MAVQSLVSAPTSKVLGLISDQGSEIPQVVCNGIKGDKTNTLKQETNYKSQTNDRYKIRKVLTKKWEIHTHTYTHINKTKAICQQGNKTTKAKQTNKHNEEKREKEKNKERLEKQI